MRISSERSCICKNMSLFIILAMVVLLPGCSEWGGLKTVNVSGLQSNGYPAPSKNAKKTHAPGQSPVVGQESKNIAVDDDRYVIQPGDTLSVKFFF